VSKRMASLVNREAIRRMVIAAVRFVLIVGISYIILMPILTKISSSLMLERDLYDQTVKWVPRHFTFKNYIDVWKNLEYPRAFLNSFLLALTAGILQTASSTFIGYGLARFEFRGRNLLFAIVMVMLIVPPQTIMIPLYMNFRYFTLFGLLPSPGINMMGSFWPFVLMSITGTGLRNGLFIYIMRQSFKGMPNELEEAAYVDGAGPVRTFYQIMLPSAVPTLVTVFLFACVWQWNDDCLTPLFMGGRTILPVTLSGLLFRMGPLGTGGMRITGQYASLLNNTGMLLFIAPLLIIYGLLQRYFVESVERTGLVG
jgi:multiple sugar transport system permease protein